MILGFKKQFVEPIMAGTKIHTIREDKTDRWYPGTQIHMATGVRTKHYNCFSDQFKCVSTQRIFMTLGWNLEITVDFDSYLYNADKLRLIANDGLTYDEFIKWFFPGDKDEFSGTIIHWTALRY
jgi:hypothetical protein